MKRKRCIKLVLLGSFSLFMVGCLFYFFNEDLKESVLSSAENIKGNLILSGTQSATFDPIDTKVSSSGMDVEISEDLISRLKGEWRGLNKEKLHLKLALKDKKLEVLSLHKIEGKMQ